jgi:hypothetical protein
VIVWVLCLLLYFIHVIFYIFLLVYLIHKMNIKNINNSFNYCVFFGPWGNITDYILTIGTIKIINFILISFSYDNYIFYTIFN